MLAVTVIFDQWSWYYGIYGTFPLDMHSIAACLLLCCDPPVAEVCIIVWSLGTVACRLLTVLLGMTRPPSFCHGAGMLITDCVSCVCAHLDQLHLRMPMQVVPSAFRQQAAIVPLQKCAQLLSSLTLLSVLLRLVSSVLCLAGGQ